MASILQCKIGILYTFFLLLIQIYVGVFPSLFPTHLQELLVVYYFLKKFWKRRDVFVFFFKWGWLVFFQHKFLSFSHEFCNLIFMGTLSSHTMSTYFFRYDIQEQNPIGIKLWLHTGNVTLITNSDAVFLMCIDIVVNINVKTCEICKIIFI